MNYSVYCIKDTKVGFMTPFLQPNDDVAIREFKNIINFSDNVISTNYTDMQLFKLGSFNQSTGEIVSEVCFIVNGVDLKECDVCVE